MTTSKLFEQLQNNAMMMSGTNRYIVASLPDVPHKLGCTTEGFPKFFIVVNKDAGGMIKNLNAELLSVEYDTLCDIVEGGEQIDNQLFTIITLRSDNEQLQRTFIEVFLMMLRMLPTKPSKMMIAAKIENLLSIFAKLKRRPIHKIQGLWAELLLIERSIDSMTVAKAWHSSPESKYDFTMGRDKVEVKSTSSENRVHRFSLDQLNPSENSNLLICSVIVRESGKDANGLSVYNLYDRISKKIADDEVRLHVYEVMLDTLGTDFYSAMKKYFDYSSACDDLRFFEYTDIPKIEKSNIPELVTEVRFSADLSHLTDIREKGFDREDSVLFNALY